MEMIFDSHAHYDDERFDEDRDSLLLGLKDKGIGRVLNAAANLKSSIAASQLAKKYDFIYNSVGVHPECAGELDDEILDELAKLCELDKTRAIGEIGLDYHYEDAYPIDIQKKSFEKQLALAKDLNMPVIIHSRDAAEDTLEIVKKFKPKGIIHCFSYSNEIAKEYVKLGMYVGFTGVVTFKGAKKPLLAAKEVGLDRLLIETDCPYLAPEPNRGKRCDSSMLIYTAKVLSENLGCSFDELVKCTFENANSVYEL